MEVRTKYSYKNTMIGFVLFTAQLVLLRAYRIPIVYRTSFPFSYRYCINFQINNNDNVDNRFIDNQVNSNSDSNSNTGSDSDNHDIDSGILRRNLYYAVDDSDDVFHGISLDNMDDMQERRVLRLIRKINESLINEEFSAPLWNAIQYEASTGSENDLKASTLLTNAILSQPNFEDALIDYVSNLLETPLFQATQIRNIFSEVVSKNASITSAWALDLIASALRDDSLPNVVSVFLFNKGFHSLVTYRISHSLWLAGRDGLARYFQSLSSRIFASDIHPACCIGQGCFMSCSGDIVIGETASVGNDCFINHGVTLGGTGKESGDRHPKVGNGVFIEAGATVLGNILIGDGSFINAGSVVTKPVKPYTRVGGVPAKLIE